MILTRAMPENFRSLNQIEQVARKAARAVGLPWGLADEAGGALRWLHCYGFNAAEIFARWLASAAAGDTEGGAPRELRGVWRARRGDLHPFLTGAAARDHSAYWDAPAMRCAGLAYPLLAAGCVGAQADSLAEHAARALVLEWDGARIFCRPGAVAVAGAPAAFVVARADSFAIAAVDADAIPTVQWRAPRFGDNTIRANIWECLEKFAAQTYVAVSDLSRGGAGAGLTDND